jgi:hypothetical protein
LNRYGRQHTYVVAFGHSSSTRALPDGQPNAWAMLDRGGEDLPRFVQATSGIEQPS